MLRLLAFLSVLVVGHASYNYMLADSSIELYWHSRLPNTPMPLSIRQLIKPGQKSNRVISPTCTVSYYMKWRNSARNVSRADILSGLFLKKNLYPGAQLKGIHLMNKTVEGNLFVSRIEADMISFSSKNLPNILEHFSMAPSSDAAKLMKDALDICEAPPLKGEKGFCSTSLESMVDNVISLKGTNGIQALTTTSNGPSHDKTYTVVSPIKKLSEHDKPVICHPLTSPQAMHYCHTNSAYEALMIPLVGSDGSLVNALTLCHHDLENFDIFNILSILEVKKSDSICHFLPEDHVVWVHKS